MNQQLVELKLEHRDLDLAIARLQADIQADELTVKRMKKRKLPPTAQIAQLESDMIPDEQASKPLRPLRGPFDSRPRRLLKAQTLTLGPARLHSHSCQKSKLTVPHWGSPDLYT